jgi:hypothetical protein
MGSVTYHWLSKYRAARSKGVKRSVRFPVGKPCTVYVSRVQSHRGTVWECQDNRLGMLLRCRLAVRTAPELGR